VLGRRVRNGVVPTCTAVLRRRVLCIVGDGHAATEAVPVILLRAALRRVTEAQGTIQQSLPGFVSIHPVGGVELALVWPEVLYV
jgi:hypothetical protein